jgi:hypothetical protein
VRADLAARFARLRKTSTLAFAGRGGWLFGAADVGHYSHGPFWGEGGAANRLAKEGDPLTALASFNAALKKRGIKLLVLPVPGKVLLYGDKLVPPIDPHPLEGVRQQFLHALAERGVAVLDLLPELRRMRAKGHDTQLRKDNHWSPVAVRLAADKVAERIKAEPWYAAVPKHEALVHPDEQELQGDLGIHAADLGSDTVTVEEVKLDGAWVGSDDKSPVVLMGDSHTLVFHNLLTDHAGLSDLLAADLGFAVDNIGVMGSGGTASLATLARRRDNMEGKRYVIWVFSERVLSMDRKGWPQIPVFH